MFGRYLAWLAALRGWRARAACVALGMLSAAALPPVTASPVLLLTVPGLLTLLGAQPGWRGAGWSGFWFGFGLNLLGLYWITEAIMIEAARVWWLVPFAVPGLSAAVAVYIAVPCALARLVPAGWRRVAVFAASWMLADLVRQFAFTGFPWNPLGSTWELPGAAGNAMIQPAAWVSVHGLTLLTLLLAATPLLGRRAMAAGALLLALWAGGGLWRLGRTASPPPGVTAVLVQQNSPEGEVVDEASAAAVFRRELTLTRQGVAAAQGGRTVVVWPETASPYLLTRDAIARADIMAVTHGPALIGSVRFDRRRRPRNSLVAMVDAGPPVAVYDKWHLVPFGEYAPGWIPISIPTLPGGGMAAGRGPKTLNVPGLPPVGALICYEAIFPGAVVAAADRPQWLVNVTNDAWFGNSAGPRQHLAAVRMRAVEEGLPVMRAANTGISAGFDAFGRELARLPMNRLGVLDVAIPGYLPPTLFARLGLLAPLCLGVGVLLCAALPRRRRA